MSEIPDYAIPLTIRDVAPGSDFTRLDPGERADGLPDGVHTGGCWLSPDGEEVYKPLDGRPFANSEYHLPTREANVLEVMAGEPAFPRNWRVEEGGELVVDGRTYTRRWLVRPKAWLVPEDVDPARMELEDVLVVERGLRLLNMRGWEIGDDLKVAYARDGVFILDLSNAWTYPRADDEWRFLKWAEAMGFGRLVRLRREARRVRSLFRISEDPHWPRADEGHPDASYQHVYASGNGPISDLRVHIPEAHCVSADPHGDLGVRAWVVTREPLDAETVHKYELTWGWAPARQPGPPALD